MYTKLMNLKDALEYITDNDVIRIGLKSAAILGSILAGKEIAKKSNLVTGIMATACMAKVTTDLVEAVIDKADDIAFGIECMQDDEFDDDFPYDDEIPSPFEEEPIQAVRTPSVDDITEEPMQQPQYSAKHLTPDAQDATSDKKDNDDEASDTHG